MATTKLPGIAELIKNRGAFEKQRKDLELTNHGEFAIFSKGELKGIFSTKEDAYRKGYSDYGAGEFTLHEIGEKPKSTGSARPYTLEELKADGLV